MGIVVSKTKNFWILQSNTKLRKKESIRNKNIKFNLTLE